MFTKIKFNDKIQSMATTSNLGTILRWYASKIDSAFVGYRDFLEYIKKYAAHHIEEQPSLIIYLENTEENLKNELKKLSKKKEIYLQNFNTQKPVIIVTSYYSIFYANKYKEIINSVTIPFPNITDLPKQLPPDVIERVDAEVFIPKFYEHQDLSSPVLYGLTLPRDIPLLLFPGCVPVQYIIKASIEKIKHMLKKEEYHDYFQKKMRIANHGKELTSQTFFNKFVMSQETQDITEDLKSDNFYFWTQLLYFIRQDFEKVKDRTLEDTNILQAVALCEIHSLNQKQIASDKEAKQQALNELKLALSKPPYFFSMDSILKIKDSKGVLLYGQYDEEDLKELLKKITTESVNSALPSLLVFKIESGTRYFIYKDRVFPLIVRLANEAHDIIEKDLTQKWIKALENYRKLPEMKDTKVFESCLEDEVKNLSPVLYSLLNANFLTMLHFESEHSNEDKKFKLFENGHLVSYTNLLMLKNSSILNNAKTLLPFWYTFPLISWIIGLFAKKHDKTEVKSEVQPTIEKREEPKKSLSKREAIVQSSKTIINDLVPEGSTIDRELDSYLKQWNHMLTKEAYNQLTEDVNCLIRDYMRKVIRTVSSQSFTLSRVQSLAESLVSTPNMQKIKEHDALLMYVELFILRLVSNG